VEHDDMNVIVLGSAHHRLRSSQGTLVEGFGWPPKIRTKNGTCALGKVKAWKQVCGGLKQ